MNRTKCSSHVPSRGPSGLATAGRPPATPAECSPACNGTQRRKTPTFSPSSEREGQGQGQGLPDSSRQVTTSCKNILQSGFLSTCGWSAEWLGHAWGPGEVGGLWGGSSLMPAPPLPTVACRRPVLRVTQAASPLLASCRHPLRGRGGGHLRCHHSWAGGPPTLQSVLKFMIKVSDGSSQGGSMGTGETPHTHQGPELL